MPLRIAAVAYTHYASDPRVRREAEALVGRGDEVVVFALGEPGLPATSTEGGVRIERIEMKRYRGAKSWAYLNSYGRFLTAVGLRLSREHLRERFDIVHVHTMPDFMVLAAVLPRLAGAKVILDMHDLMPELYAVKFGLKKDGLATSALRLTQRAATSFADAVISVHQNQYDLLLRDGVPARKLSIVMNAADPRLFPPLETVASIDGSGPIRVVYHGTLLHRYGVDLAVRAFAKARLLEPRLRLEILGAGDFFEPLADLVRQLGLKDVVDLTGQRRPLDEVAQRIRAAHVGIVPNRDDHEDSVLPTKLLEYISVGVPAVVTKTRCIDHFFTDDQVEMCGLDDVDAMARGILRLAQDPDRRAALVAAAREWEAQYGFDTQMKLLFRTVDALCFEKVARDRKARQKAVEGKKTGTRKTPPKKTRKKPKKAPSSAAPPPPSAR